MRGAYQGKILTILGKRSQFNKNGSKNTNNIDVTFILMSKDSVGI
jgi:hypothetical protein